MIVSHRELSVVYQVVTTANVVGLRRAARRLWLAGLLSSGRWAMEPMFDGSGAATSGEVPEENLGSGWIVVSREVRTCSLPGGRES